MSTLSNILNLTGLGLLLQKVTNLTVLGDNNISFGDACIQSSVNCNEGTGLDGGSIAAFTILTTCIVLGWFVRSCCCFCLYEKSIMPSADRGYETESETVSDGSSEHPCDETISVDEEAQGDNNLPCA